MEKLMLEFVDYIEKNDLEYSKQNVKEYFENIENEEKEETIKYLITLCNKNIEQLIKEFNKCIDKWNNIETASVVWSILCGKVYNLEIEQQRYKYYKLLLEIEDNKVYKVCDYLKERYYKKEGWL